MNCRRVFTNVSFFLVALLFIPSVDAQTTVSGARVTGRVLDATSSAPIAGANVILVPAERPRAAVRLTLPPQAVTNDNGVYVFDGITAGRYRVQAQKTGFVASSLTDAALVDARAGQMITGPDLRLGRGGAISGRLLDGRGEPLADMLVAAVRPPSGAYPNGLALPAGQWGQTNDLGEFRISGLPAGEYYVAARPRPQPPFARTSPASGTTMVTTYYPGTAEISAGQPVVVPSGETISGIQFLMLSAPAFSISGIVVDDMERPLGEAMVSIMPDGRDRVGLPASARTRADGTFRLDNVTTGTYRLEAMIPMVAGSVRTWSSSDVPDSISIAPGGVPAPRRVGATPPETVQVTVDAGDVTGVKLVVRPR